MRATNTLMRAVRTAYHLGPPRTAFRHLLKTLIFTALLIVTIVLTLTLLTVGNVVLSYAIEHFGLPVGTATLWVRLRFPVMALLMYFALYLLYAMTQDERQPQRNLYPGVLAALLGWMVASFLFSLYVENIASYSILYGSIGTLIVLLMWLYLSAVFLIMGAELNGTLVSMRKEQKTEKLSD
jgi:membrane protein